MKRTEFYTINGIKKALYDLQIVASPADIGLAAGRLQKEMKCKERNGKKSKYFTSDDGLAIINLLAPAKPRQEELALLTLESIDVRLRALESKK